jgi:hypothetical protein
VEDVRLVGRLDELAHQQVDRMLVGQVGEVDFQLIADLPDVVQRAARGRAHERVDAGPERDEALGQVRAHEAVGAGDEHRPVAVEGPEVLAQLRERLLRPDRVVSVRHDRGDAARA